MVQKNRGLTGGQQTRPPRHIFMSGLAAGALVTTLDGELPVEFLHAGDRIVTLDRGMVKLRAITARPVYRNDLIRVSPRSLDPRTEAPDFWIAAEQPLLLRDWRAKAMYGRPRVLVPTARLLDGEHLRRETGGGQTMLFQLHFEDKHVIRVGGLDLTSTPLKGLKRRPKVEAQTVTGR
ncbi:Hint domain-containing protein [Aliiroseovarius sp.]|uniref:Hint domain-containing protein n=1 Tax=Aliiroseovarius sp. TaxID=1872442 RepID=UPI003BADB3CC